MKKRIITLLAVVLGTAAFAQVKNGVGIGAKKVVPSAALQIDATDKGVLIPRIALTDVKTYGLAGADKGVAAVDGMLVYNTTAGTEANGLALGFYFWQTDKWELVTSESKLTTIITDIREEVKTEINNITNITGGGTEGGGEGTPPPGGTTDNPYDMSYLVAFRPDKDGVEGTGKMYYLYPETKDGKTTYTRTGISFADLVKGEETNTMIRPIMESYIPEGETKAKERIKGYVYFNEAALLAWSKDPANVVGVEIPDNYGLTIDISSVVTNIFSEKETIKELERIIEKTEGSIRIVYEKDADGNPIGDPKLEYTDANGNPKTDFPFNKFETKTTFKKFVAGKDGKETLTDEDFTVTTDVAPTGLKEGAIVYKYYNEDAAKPNYINLTSDIVETITNNETVKEIVNNTVVEKLSEGGNVYYDELKAGEGKVLFQKTKDADGNDVNEPIDITKDILTVIEKDKTIIEKIKELTTVKVEGGTDLPTGDVINEKAVYKGFSVITVEGETGYDYASDFVGSIAIAPKKVVVDADGNVTTEPVADAKFGRLLKATVLAKDGSVVLTTVTDVEAGADSTSFKFSFGTAGMYTPLTNGTYEVIYEYVVK